MKTKKRSLFLFLLFLTCLFAWGQNLFSQVLARVSPYLIRIPEQLDFGIVFPQENLLKNYKVSFGNDIETDIYFDYVASKNIDSEYEETITITQGNSIKYQILEERKKVPEGYKGEEDPNLPGYYRNLCPHIESTSNEGEGDLPSASLLGGSDPLDTWILNFTVPPIEGYVAQGEEEILTVPTSGDYGCDLVLDEVPRTTTLTVDLPQDCLDFVSASPPEDSYNSTNGVITWVFTNVYYADQPSVTFKVKPTHECTATTLITYDDGFEPKNTSGTETLAARSVLGEVLGLMLPMTGRPLTAIHVMVMAAIFITFLAVLIFGYRRVVKLLTAKKPKVGGPEEE